MSSTKVLAFACYCAVISFTAASNTLTEVVYRFRHRSAAAPLPPATSFINVNVYSDSKCTTLIGTDSIAQGICVVDFPGTVSFTISTTATSGSYTYQPYTDAACTNSVTGTAVAFQLPAAGACPAGSSTNPLAPSGTYYTATVVTPTPTVTQPYYAKMYASKTDCQSGNGNYMELVQYPINCMTVSSLLSYLVVSSTSIATCASSNCASASCLAAVTFTNCAAQISGISSYGYPQITAPSSSSSSSSSCFSGSETVTIESGESKFISEVSVGDRILAANAAGSMSFSTVIAVPHGKNSIVTDFNHISTVSRDIRMTPDHLIFTGTCGSSTFSLVKASDVEPGVCIKIVEGEEMVTSNELTKSTGIYTVVTEKEYVVVNGIVASPFANNHYLGNAYYSLHRTVFAVIPALFSSQWISTAQELFANMIMAVSA